VLIVRYCPGKDGDKVRHGEDNRLFVDAVLWIARTEAPWRDLPKAFGNWKRVCQPRKTYGIASSARCMGVMPMISIIFMLDATIVRAHQHAAGAKRGRQR
jgi:transposase